MTKNDIKWQTNDKKWPQRQKRQRMAKMTKDDKNDKNDKILKKKGPKKNFTKNFRPKSKKTQ